MVPKSISTERNGAKRLGHFLRQEISVFAFFNNDYNAYAPLNAAALLQLLKKSPG